MSVFRPFYTPADSAVHIAKYGPVPGVLVKFLDSAEQLPLHVHPTLADARKYLIRLRENRSLDRFSTR